MKERLGAAAGVASIAYVRFVIGPEGTSWIWYHAIGCMTTSSVA